MVNADTLPSSDDLGGPCPQCGRVSSFTVNGDPFRLTPTTLAYWLQCQGCSKGTVVIEKQIVESYASSGKARGRWAPVHWWPVPGEGQFDPDVPERVADAYDEGMRCLAVQAPRAAAVMFRATLALIVDSNASETAKAKFGLKAKLKQMATDGHLHPSLADWADTIKDLGNGGAHPDELPEPSLAEAEEMSRLCRRMIEFFYEINARIARGATARGARHPGR